ncbi:MAG: TolC family protein [Bacteroidetes bacterium]|nr:TolC family protein [Bacteroidota bacterium]
MNISKFGKIIFITLIVSTSIKAQDTLKINIYQADSIFLKNSFYLLAASMNIEAQKAQMIQAKLYPNPIFTADFNTYDTENNRAFHVGETGQKTFQFEQLILLGGKRKSEIEMAKTNVAIAELEFQQLTRNLKYQLHSSLYSVGQQEFLLHKYNQQLTLLDSLLSAYQTQVDKGNIPLKELVRLKGAYLKLNNDRAELFKEYFATQSTLQKVLQVFAVVKFEFSEDDIVQYVKLISLDELKVIASANRPDLLIVQQNSLLSQQYLQYQKRVAVPDINLFTSYDQRGGAFQNQVNAGISIPLPLWNRNQGNIKTAQYKLQESQYQTQSLQNGINTEIQNAYAYYSQTISEYKKATNLYNQDFEITINGMTENFQKRNVSIIEFIDFFEAYNEVLTELTRIKTQLVSSAEELNLLTGKDIY